jgi:hypothetical protein
MHSTDVQSPPPPPYILRVCMSIHSEGKSCSDFVRVLGFNDPYMRTYEHPSDAQYRAYYRSMKAEQEPPRKEKHGVHSDSNSNSNSMGASTGRGGVLRTNTRPMLNHLLFIRASVRAFTQKVSLAGVSDHGSSVVYQ